MTAYPIGALVKYVDEVATVSTGETVLATGRINGEALANDDTGEVVYVPVWTSRDNNREPTTVYVAVHNILEVTP